jgi:hypothetical protein
MSDVRVEEWIARQEIRDVLSRYCRGLDRMDREMALAVWHDDATAHYHGMFEGTGRGFVDWVWESHAHMARHSHQITNVLIEMDGDRATSEAYVTVVLWTLPAADGSQTEIVARGRYLDRWSRRGGRWAIDHREHVLDTHSNHALVAGEVSEAATRDERDPSFAYVPKA